MQRLAQSLKLVSRAQLQLGQYCARKLHMLCNLQPERFMAAAGRLLYLLQCPPQGPHPTGRLRMLQDTILEG